MTKKLHHIATLLAPKSLLPVDVWAFPRGELQLLTLGGEQLVKGHFGEELEEYDELQDETIFWNRFHSSNLTKANRGRGLGCAFYLGAALAVRASSEKGYFSGYISGTSGIYSDPDDRSDFASRLWTCMHEKGLASYSNSTIGIWHRHTFKLKGKWTENRLKAYHDKRFSPSMSYTASVRCRGGYTYGEYFHLQYVQYDLLSADAVLSSRRVLKLGPLFNSPHGFTPVLPQEFGTANWKGIEDRQVADFLWSGATASYNTKKWLREVLRSWRGSRTRLSRILSYLPQKGEIRGDRVVIEGVFPRGIRL